MLETVPLAGHPVAPLLRAAELRLWHDAEQALQQAREDADQISSAAHAAAAEERDRGYAEGLSAGQEHAAATMAATAAAAEALLLRLEADLPQLVHGIVESILGEVPHSASLVSAVRHALGRLRLGPSMTLRAAPDDTATLRAALDGPGSSLIRIEPDPALKSGSCVLSGDLGVVELGVAAQLRALKAALTHTFTTADPSAGVLTP